MDLIYTVVSTCLEKCVTNPQPQLSIAEKDCFLKCSVRMGQANQIIKNYYASNLDNAQKAQQAKYVNGVR